MSSRPSDIAIITTTLYDRPDDEVQRVRSELAKRCIATATERGFPVYVLDSGSSAAFVSDLIDARATVLINHEADMLEGRQRIMRMALDDNPAYVVWTEPEKDVSSWALSWAQACTDHDAVAVIPMRETVASYPVAQQHSERIGNLEIAEFFGREMGDWYFGPRLFTAAAAEKYWLTYDGSHGDHGRLWPSIFSPVFNALASGEHVVGVTTPFTYPAEQTQVEIGNEAMEAKRLLQRIAITDSAKHAFFEGNPHTARFTMPGHFTLSDQGISIADESDVVSRPSR